MEKIKLRKYFKNLCDNFVLQNNTQVLSEKVRTLLKDLDSLQFQKIAVYQPFKNEVSLIGLEEEEKYSHIYWLYPQKNYSFSEKPNFTVHPIEEIDLFFVPGLAFDHQCRRLGRGAGFYDRVLSGSKALKIGVSWSVQVSAEPLPEEEHDIWMDACVNEKFLMCSNRFFEKYKKGV